MMSIGTFAAGAETGLPANGEIVGDFSADAISGVAIVMPSGRPLAIPFAAVRISGSTPQCSMPHIDPPVRPKPV